MDEWTTSVTTAKKRPAMSLDDQNIGVVKKKQKDVFAVYPMSDNIGKTNQFEFSRNTLESFVAWS